MLKDDGCSAYPIAVQTLGRTLPPPPLGACMIPIVEQYLPLIRENMQVLDVGCGSWNRIERHCAAVGARYEAIDVQSEYYGKPVVATRLENLRHLSFEDERFDVVVGNQTMEHWGENGCTARWGLYQCFRACKTGGRVLMNVPIHYHGTRAFMLGRIEGICRLFAAFSDDVRLERWGYPSAPLPPLFPHGGYWRLRQKPAFVLDIQTVKDRPLPAGVNNRGACRGRLAELLNYPPSYNLFRVLRKVGLCK